MRAITLGIGTFAILYIPLDFMMDARGANDFIRPFHIIGLLTAVSLSVVTTSVIYRFWPLRTLLHRFLAALLFIHVTFALWAVALPLGDRIAIQKEREVKHTAFDLESISETGFGWYYWDDSGMGNWPMSILHFLQPHIFSLVWMLPFLIFVLLTFLQNRQKENQAQRDAPGATDSRA